MIFKPWYGYGASDVSKEPQIRATFVEFAGGAYTKLPHHLGGQILYAIEGEGFVEFYDGKIEKLITGSRVIVQAGVIHRHGTKGKYRKHLAVTVGETFWRRQTQKGQPAPSIYF